MITALLHWIVCIVVVSTLALIQDNDFDDFSCSIKGLHPGSYSCHSVESSVYYKSTCGFLLHRITDWLFTNYCVSSILQRCVSNCVDRYLEAWNVVSAHYNKKLHEGSH